MSLKTTVTTLFNDVLRMCASCENAGALEKEINEILVRLNEPLRVAVVGVMKAGKSTLLNAMMKEKILFTGNVETTYTVSWFKYAPTPGLTIVFKDGQKIDEPYENLEKWTVRDTGNKNPRLDDVKYVEIKYPNEVLKQMELIDTPGLLSTYKTDSSNTMDFLGLKQAEETTIIEASTADAIIYAFSRGAQSNDTEILKAFQGEMVTSNTTPINALGVFTKSDILWDMMDDPMNIAKQVTDNLMTNNQIKNLLYTITPVSAKVVESILEISDREWNILEKLSKLDENLLLSLLFDQTIFIESDIEDLEEAMETEFDEESKQNICSKEERKHICSICGQYGIYEITKGINDGMEKAAIIEHLYEKSGIKHINNLIAQHFGNRVFIIKLKYIFSRLIPLCTKIMNRCEDDKLYDICEHLKDEINYIQDTEQSFKELKVLQNYYNGLLKLKNEDEMKQLMEITSEYGNNCEKRLGVPEGTSIRELSEMAYEKIKYWNLRANEIPITRYYEDAAQVLSRSCNIMYYHLQALSGDNN